MNHDMNDVVTKQLGGKIPIEQKNATVGISNIVKLIVLHILVCIFSN